MNIPYGKHHLDKNDILNVSKALKGEFITQGPLIEKFEKKICNIVKAKYAVALSSCSAGLHIAVASLKKNTKKNKILTSPISFVSTANAILHNNCKPAFVDIDKFSLNICINNLKKILNKDKNIKAILPVHLGGHASSSKEIYQACSKKKITVIEDAAHSFGAKYKDGSMIGSCKYSDLTVFSFHPVKTITTGEGGVITTNSKDIYKRLLRFRNHGIQKNQNFWVNKNLGFSNHIKNNWYYEMQDLGFNYRITDIQCALGLSQLKKLKKIMKKRKEIAKIYDKELKDLKNTYIPQYKQRDKSSNHLYILNIDFRKIGITRNNFMNILLKKNIITQVHYIPIPLHPYYKKIGFNVKYLKNSMKYYDQSISIPIYYNLSIQNQKKIIKNIKNIIEKY